MSFIYKTQRKHFQDQIYTFLITEIFTNEAMSRFNIKNSVLDVLKMFKRKKIKIKT